MSGEAASSVQGVGVNGLYVGLSGGVSEVAFVHLVELFGGGEVHSLDDVAYTFAVANPPLDFVHSRVVDGLVYRCARNLRETQLSQSS